MSTGSLNLDEGELSILIYNIILTFRKCEEDKTW
jgi:hypothetical protein